MWPTVTLAQARAKRDEAKKLLAQGIDPKNEQKEAQAENSGAYTFETIAREWHASNKRWSEDHRSRVLRYLELYIFPPIVSSDIRQLKTITLTLIQPVTWPVRYRQPKRGITPLYPQADSLSFLLVLLLIVAV